MQGNVGGISSGLLEFKSQGASLLGVSVQLTTGQLLLRPGKAVQDSPEVAVYIRGV